MKDNSSTLSNEEINEIRQSVDIVDIISSYIPLTTRGKNFFGICPFHADHSPSMSVSREKQIYTCFSCGASGNVFNFVMNYENVNFIEAIKIIATKAGIPLNINIKNKNINDKHQIMYDIFELTQKFYINNINTTLGKQAKEYLSKRNINNETIKEFGIGLALSDYDSLTNLLVNKKYDFNILTKTGLVMKRDRGYSDTYINRIMFPLYDLTGRIVGYSGRIYNSESSSKYFNIKETEIFKKGELLYNYHRAKEFAKIDNRIIVVEGFMDVIRLYTVGIKNVVATMGTAVTKNQALLIKRLGKEIVLCFDGDEAGNEATNSCINELEKIGVIPKVVRLENNLDPDEYIIKNGKNAFLDNINNAINVMDYKMNYLKKEKNLNSDLDIAKYVDSVINELSKIDNETYIELTINKLSKETNLDTVYLKKKLNKEEIKEVKINKKKEKKKETKCEIAEKRLLYYMLNNKEVIKQYYRKKPKFQNDNYEILAKEIFKYYKEYGQVNLADLITYFNDSDNLSSVIKELLSENIKDDYLKKEIDDYIDIMEKNSINIKIKELNQKMLMETNSIKKAEIGEEIKKLKIEIMGDEIDDKRD